MYQAVPIHWTVALTETITLPSIMGNGLVSGVSSLLFYQKHVKGINIFKTYMSFYHDLFIRRKSQGFSVDGLVGPSNLQTSYMNKCVLVEGEGDVTTPLEGFMMRDMHVRNCG